MSTVNRDAVFCAHTHIHTMCLPSMVMVGKRHGVPCRAEHGGSNATCQAERCKAVRVDMPKCEKKLLKETKGITSRGRICKRSHRPCGFTGCSCHFLFTASSVFSLRSQEGQSPSDSGWARTKRSKEKRKRGETLGTHLSLSLCVCACVVGGGGG